MPKLIRPPGARRVIPGKNLFAFQRDPLKFMLDLTHTYGDISYFKMGGQAVYFINHPDLIRDVLVTHQDAYAKGRALQRAKRLLGEGLLTSENPLHRRQRRLVQPAFHRARITGYGEVMIEYAARFGERWRDGMQIDVAREMNRLTLAIVGKTLFGANTEAEADEVGTALSNLLGMFGYLMLPFSEVLEKLPLPAARRFRQARAQLDAVIYRIINERRASREDAGDLLSMLLLAQDEEAGADSDDTVKGDNRMSDVQIRDEALTLFLAGHETTANWLAFAWYMLATNPEVETRLHEELDRVLDGRLPTPADVPSLVYTEMVLSEVLRVRPPAYAVGRLSIKETTLGEYIVPPGTLVIMSQYVMHHDPRYYDEPDEFRPERWAGDVRGNRPQFAYFPFGGGARRCIGDGFAWTEAILIIATLAARWRMRVAQGFTPELQPRITLRPKHGIPVTLYARR